MNKRWKLFFGEVIGLFILMASLTLLSDYWTIGETAFNDLLTLKFYIGKIIFSLLFALSGFIKFGKREIGKQ